MSISMLLPTRGRTEQLVRSINSLIDLADNPKDIQWLFGFDSDDRQSSDYCQQHVLPRLEEIGAEYSCLEFAPMGYARLHEYVNALAKHATGDWFVFWNDDAVMLDQHWDTVINSYTGQFCLQAFDTHNQHPYSIFPIVPREWFEVLGHLSLHQLNDAWLSQIAWLLDIVVRLDIRVQHDRADLTGKNDDATYRQRVVFEGNVNDPRDFNHINNRHIRYQEADQLSKYLQGRGYDMTVWEEVKAGKRDGWAKMLASDVNKQMAKFK